MKIAAGVRHPNLLQFIGATRVGTPIILSELMPTSLRKKLQTGPLPYHAVLAISQDIACGLNYLHLFKPDPILHRNVCVWKYMWEDHDRLKVIITPRCLNELTCSSEEPF